MQDEISQTFGQATGISLSVQCEGMSLMLLWARPRVYMSALRHGRGFMAHTRGCLVGGLGLRIMMEQHPRAKMAASSSPAPARQGSKLITDPCDRSHVCIFILVRGLITYPKVAPHTHALNTSSRPVWRTVIRFRRRVRPPFGATAYRRCCVEGTPYKVRARVSIFLV